jgi:hypothetical protein
MKAKHKNDIGELMFDPKVCAKTRGFKSCKQCPDKYACKAAINI